MTTTDILIIGAGAAGLMAARELSKAGKKVIVLEARDRTGGRIHTVHDPAFAMPVERGAEFVHGDLQLTIKLLREAAIEYYTIEGELWRSTSGRLTKQDDFLENQGELVKRLKALEQDMSVKKFLDTYFAGEQYAELRKALIDFVHGYDAADISYASSFSLLQELLGEQASQQYRIKGGYGRLVDFLVNECIKMGCIFELSTVVSTVNWRAGEVTVTTRSNKTYSAGKVIITVPISVLQAMPDEPAHISINPLPEQVRQAIQVLGVSGVIKLVLQFNNAFWKNSQPVRESGAEKIGFVFSDAPVPTWWTQLPEDNAIFTGWLAGPGALLWKELPDENILQQALESLSWIFSTELSAVESQMKAYQVANWTADNYTLGAYGYEKVESKQAKRILNTPLEDSLFFCGEALYEGPEHGTVEGALKSAEHVISQILRV